MDSAATITYRRPFFSTSMLLMFSFLGLAYAVVGFAAFDDRHGVAGLYLLGLVQLTPFLVCMARRQFDFVSLIAVSYFLVVTVGKYNQIFIIDQNFQIDPISRAAIRELTISMLIIYSSYYFVRTFFCPTVDRTEQKKNALLTMTPLLALFLLFIGAISPFVVVLLPSAVQALWTPVDSMVCVLLVCSACPRYPRLFVFGWALVYLARVVYFFYSGTMGAVFFFSCTLFLAALIRPNYLILIVLTFATLVGMAVQSVKGQYRTVLLSAAHLSVLDRFETLEGLLALRYSGRSFTGPSDQDEDASPSLDAEATRDGLSSGLNRLDDDSLERVLDQTPNRVPFWNGSSYSYIFFMFIPRALWPGKPGRTLWHEFGRKYGYLDDSDSITSVSVSYLAEGYMNFGYAGLYATALFMGCFIAFVEWLSDHVFGQYYHFSFLLFLIPISTYSLDLSSIVSLTAMILAAGLAMRRPILYYFTGA